jgi:predicted nucleic acid-binding protein
MSPDLALVQNSPLLIDTNLLIDALRNRFGRAALLDSLAKKGYVLTISAINVAEVYAGLRPGEETTTQALLDGLRCIPVTPAALADCVTN